MKANVIASNRDLFKAIQLVMRKAAPDALSSTITSFRGTQADAEKDFGLYRATPLEDDERAAGDDFARDWPAYVAEVEKVFSLLLAGEANQAADLADGSAIPLYRKTIGELK